MPSSESQGGSPGHAPSPAQPPRAAPSPAWFTGYLRLIALLLFVISFLKGARMPNLWAATHLTFNYSHGFIRRGFVGQVFRVLGARRNDYDLLALASAVLLVLVALALALVIGKALRANPGDLGLWGAVLVFAASPGLVFFVHEIGYLDHLGLLVLLLFILALARRPTGNRYLGLCAAVPVGALLALVHESLVVMFAPVMLFAMLCRIVVQTPGERLARRTRPLLMVAAAAAAASALVASALVSAFGTKSPAVIQALQSSIARTANFPLRGDAFQALYRPVREAATTVMPDHWRYPVNQRYLITGLVVAFPSIAFLTSYGVRLLRRLALGAATRRTLTAALLVAALAPLTLNFVGWDSARWSAISLVDSLLCVAVLRLFFPSSMSSPVSSSVSAARAGSPTRSPLDSPLSLTLAAATVVLGLCSSNYTGFLFDGYLVKWFPFDTQLDSLLELLKGHFSFIPSA
jgi:hypothetical protein